MAIANKKVNIKLNKDNNNFPTLPPEIIDHILKHIKDQNTLFSCLLVNRLWCRKVVPVLWAKPKPLLYKEKAPRSLIETYISCFNEEERSILFSHRPYKAEENDKEKGEKGDDNDGKDGDGNDNDNSEHSDVETHNDDDGNSNNDNDNNNNSISNSNVSNVDDNNNSGVDKTKGGDGIVGGEEHVSDDDYDLLNMSNPLFEYAAFLKELDYNILRAAVRKSYKNIGGKEFSRKIKPLKPDLNPNRQMTVMKALIKLFMRCSVLDSVKFNSLYDDIPSFAAFVNGQHSLSNISRLQVSPSCNLPNTLTLLQKLPQLCNNIRHIIINSADPVISEHLTNIIKAQQNLISLELTGSFDNVSSIILSLTAHVSTLTSAKFIDIDYQWRLHEILIKCSNLKSLELVSDDSNLSNDEEKEINFSLSPTFCNLKTLKLINQKSIYSSLILQNSGGTLRKLSLNTVNKRVVDSILKFCSNIVDMSLDVSNAPNNDFSQHSRLLKGLRLVSLVLVSDSAKCMDLLLAEITNILPVSLLYLDFEKEFTLESLGKFISSCKTPIKELTILPNSPIDSDYVSMIINYSKNKSSLEKLRLNLSWETSFINDRYTKELVKDPKDELFIIELDKLRDCDV